MEVDPECSDQAFAPNQNHSYLLEGSFHKLVGTVHSEVDMVLAADNQSLSAAQSRDLVHPSNVDQGVHVADTSVG